MMIVIVAIDNCTCLAMAVMLAVTTFTDVIAVSCTSALIGCTDQVTIVLVMPIVIIIVLIMSPVIVVVSRWTTRQYQDN